MTGFYDEDIAFALEMIEEFGMQCTWTKDTGVPADANRPWLGGTAQPEPHQPFICFVPATDTTIRGLTTIRFAKDGDTPDFSTIGLMGAQDFEPELTDKLSDGSRTMVLVDVQKLAPAGQAVLYILSIK